MAKASIECRCEKCGKMFVREKFFDRRPDADRWEAWMKDHLICVGVCLDCYRKDKDEKMAAENEEIIMKYRDYKNSGFSKLKTKRDSYDANTKTIVVYVPKIWVNDKALGKVIYSGKDGTAEITYGNDTFHIHLIPREGVPIGDRDFGIERYAEAIKIWESEGYKRVPIDNN